MTKYFIISLLIFNQAFGQNLGRSQVMTKEMKDKITYLEADIKVKKNLIEYELKKLAVLQEFMESGSEPVYIESRNMAAVAFAASILSLTGLVKYLQFIDRKKMSADQIAKYKEWYLKNEMGSVKNYLIVIGSLLIVTPLTLLLIDEDKSAYMRKLDTFSGVSLQKEQSSIVESITRYSEALQSSQAQLNNLKSK